MESRVVAPGLGSRRPHRPTPRPTLTSCPSPVASAVPRSPCRAPRRRA